MRCLGFIFLLMHATAWAQNPSALNPSVPSTSVPGKVSYHQEIMGTIIEVTFWTEDAAAASQGAEALFKEFSRLDALMSNWQPQSDVSRVNAAAGTAPVQVSADTLKVVSFGQEVAKASGGAFDMTVGAYRGVWKFDEDKDGTLPDPGLVAERKALVNYRDVVVNRKKHTVFLKRAGMALNLGGIAKGYAVDQGVALLKKKGFRNFILQAGGDMYLAGSKGGTPWRIGIRDPRGDKTASFALTDLEDETFSTSGDYERFVIKDGKRYHHILDPTTGYPAGESRSVTVIAKSAMIADAWSKVLFILGAEKAMQLLAQRKQLSCVFVDKNGQVHVSPNLKWTKDNIEKNLKRALFGEILQLRAPTDGI